MKKYRGLRLCMNLFLTVLVLVMLWAGMGFPLPTELAYRRMERAMLLEPMEILYQGEDDCVLSVDEEHLGLYTGDYFGTPMHYRSLYLFPLENGLGRAIRKHTFFGMDVWAYDASGRSTSVDMELQIGRDDLGPKTIRESAQLKNGFFPIHVNESLYHNELTYWHDTALEAMIASEIGANLHFADISTYESWYSMTLTFYDEAGNVTAVHESEGTYAY